MDRPPDGLAPRCDPKLTSDPPSSTTDGRQVAYIHTTGAWAARALAGACGLGAPAVRATGRPGRRRCPVHGFWEGRCRCRPLETADQSALCRLDAQWRGARPGCSGLGMSIALCAPTGPAALSAPHIGEVPRGRRAVVRLGGRRPGSGGALGPGRVGPGPRVCARAVAGPVLVGRERGACAPALSRALSGACTWCERRERRCSALRCASFGPMPERCGFLASTHAGEPRKGSGCGFLALTHARANRGKVLRGLCVAALRPHQRARAHSLPWREHGIHERDHPVRHVSGAARPAQHRSSGSARWISGRSSRRSAASTRSGRIVVGARGGSAPGCFVLEVDRRSSGGGHTSGLRPAKPRGALSAQQCVCVCIW